GNRVRAGDACGGCRGGGSGEWRRRAAEAGSLPGDQGRKCSAFGGRAAALSADETAGTHGAGKLLAGGRGAVAAPRGGESVGAGGEWTKAAGGSGRAGGTAE